MRFKTAYYTEKIVYPKSGDFVKVSQQAIDQIKKLKYDNVDIFWRGFVKKRIAAPVLTITGDDRQDDFRGGSLPGPAAMMKILGIKNPAFARQDQSVRLFGTPMIVVPLKPYKIFQSSEVEDMAWSLQGKDLQKVAKTYKNTTKNLGGEVIFDMKKYLLVDPDQLNFTLHKKNGIESLKKYKDVVKLLEDYIDYIKNYRKRIRNVK